eukprot:scaffold6420_cov168-Amphora_coffeaeformis.AAC.41
MMMRFLINQSTRCSIWLFFVLLLSSYLFASSLAWTAAAGLSSSSMRQRRASLLLELAPQQLGIFETLDVKEEDRVTRTVRLETYTTPCLPYQVGWDRQQALWQGHSERLSRQQQSWTQSQFDGFDTLLIVQHEPIYTLGTASDESFIRDSATVPVQRINRGGEVTYHGPGQLTVYPVLDLRGYNQDIHWYMRALEQVVLQALESVGIPNATRDENTTGVWVNNHKVAAVGVHARKWITQHGLAINVTPKSLEAFAHIVPCGLEGRKVGCVQQFVKHDVSIDQIAVAVQNSMEDVFGITLDPDV